MNGPLAPRTFPLGCRWVALAVTLAMFLPIAPHEASAKGGAFHLFPAVVRAEAKTVTSPAPPEVTTITFGGCGGKRYRDPSTHRCRGPADAGR
jgi:hypothetical protein